MQQKKAVQLRGTLINLVQLVNSGGLIFLVFWCEKMLERMGKDGSLCPFCKLSLILGQGIPNLIQDNLSPILFCMYGEKIRTIRELRNFSQEYMASELGIAQNTYSKIETGQSKLTAEMLKNLAELLGVSPVDILSSHPAIISFGITNVKENSNANDLYRNQQEFLEKMLASKDNEIHYLKEIIFALIRDKETMMKFMER
jgi:transcriptional regulator with XRE-family HTH domain